MDFKAIKNLSFITIKHMLLSFLSLIMFFPFLWMITSALKTKDEIWQFPPTWWPAVPQWHHFTEAWTMAPFDVYIFNSIFTAGIIVLIQIVNSAMIAYAFTQFNSKAKISYL